MGLSIHCYSSSFSWPLRYTTCKSSGIGQIYLNSIIYIVCLFSLTVRSVGQFVIQIVKIIYIGLIKLYSIIYGFVYSLLQFAFQLITSLFKSKSNEYRTT